MVAQLPHLKDVGLGDCAVTESGLAQLRARGIQYEITQTPTSSYEIIKMFDDTE
jgi:hypothetical protein